MNIKNQHHMTFTTIALSKGYFFTSVNNETLSNEEKLEFLKTINAETNLLTELISIQAEVMRYGYMFDIESMKAMLSMSADDLCNISKDIAAYLASTYGDGNFVSLFGNFPAAVMEMSTREMFIHQIIHYLSNGEYQPHFYVCPESDIELSQQMFNDCVRDDYKMISYASVETMTSIFTSMLSAQQSLTSYDKEIVEYYCNNAQGVLCENILDIIPADIPFKETLCIVAANVKDYPIKNITDVLRMAVYMSNGDITLPAIPKSINYGWCCNKVDKTPFNFKKFSRAERRLILSKIEKVFDISNEYDIYADMKKYANKWVRLGEIIHPSEYKAKYPSAYSAFYMMRECAKFVDTYYGKLDYARKKKDLNLILSTLAQRPGEFARNIDWVLRKYSNLDDVYRILNKFASVVDKVSSKVIYELIDRYAYRNSEEALTNRYIFIKGSRKRTHIKDLPRLNDATVQALLSILLESLDRRFLEKGDLTGSKYIIDGGLSNIMLPKNMRSMNIAPGQQTRGTKIPLNINTELLRLYCRWMDPHGKYDLDLSVTAFNEKFDTMFTMSWDCHYKKKDNEGKDMALFSGDVRHRVGNSAEYIDVHIERLKKFGVRYLVADVRDFDGLGFTKKDAWGGIMERTIWGTPGETTWAPDTISCGFKLTSQCTNIIMSIVDLEEMVMYVVDEDTAGIPVASRNTSVAKNVLKKYVNQPPYFNALSLIEKNLKARNAEVNVVSHESFNDFVNNIEEIKANLVLMKQEVEKLREAGIGENSVFEVNTYLDAKLAKINEKIALMEAIHIVSYDDISRDYTRLFEWMF